MKEISKTSYNRSNKVIFALISAFISEVNVIFCSYIQYLSSIQLRCKSWMP